MHRDIRTLEQGYYWSAEQRIQYATLILYHNIKKSDEERKIKMIEEQEKKNYSNTFYKKVQQISKTLEIEIDKVTGKKSSMEKRGEGESDIKGKKENH